MLCTFIYFADIGSFDGKEMLPPPPDPGVDIDDDEGMPDAEDHQEVGADQRPAPAGAPLRGRLNDARYRMELGDKLIALIVEVASGLLISETYRLITGYHGCGEVCCVTCTD